MAARACFASRPAWPTACAISPRRPAVSSTSPTCTSRPSQRRATKAGCRGTSRAATCGRSRAAEMKLLVTGGCGFIGSNFIRHVLTEHADDRIVNLDKLTYAGNPANVADLERHPRYSFVHGDICDADGEIGRAHV